MLLAIFLVFFPQLMAQVLVGNGGDGVRCSDRLDAEQFPAGYFVLDFVLTRKLGPIVVIDDPLQRIVHKLENIAELGPVFRDFVVEARAQIRSGVASNGVYRWSPESLDQENVNDSDLFAALPANCRGIDGVVRLEQLVIRQFRGSYTEHLYDRDLVAELTADPYQESFLLTHEFLWRYATNAATIRDVNWFLHSAAIDGMTPDSLKAELEARGLNIRMYPETVVTQFSVSEGGDGSLKPERTEMSFFRPNWWVENEVRVTNSSSVPILVGSYSNDASFSPLCLPDHLLESGQSNTISVDENIGQYFWISRLGTDGELCPAVRERSYIYLRERFSP